MDFAETKEPLITWQLFKKQLRLQGKTYIWLAAMMNLSYHHTYRLLNGMMPITENNYNILKELLEFDLPAVKSSSDK